MLHELGFKTVTMALTDKSIASDDPDLNREPRLAIVMGTEGDGLPQDLRLHGTDRHGLRRRLAQRQCRCSRGTKNK